MKRLKYYLLLLAGALLIGAAVSAEESKNPMKMFDEHSSKEPTFVRAKQLVLKNKDRTFQYSGDVEVTQGDLILTADVIDGTYTEKNQIDKLIARKHVVITKGEGIRATGERADFDQATQTMVLSENPELQQNGSILTADRIRVFMQENRSVAEGKVRVKLARAGGLNPSDVVKKHK